MKSPTIEEYNLLADIRRRYESDENISLFLKNKQNHDLSDSDIIEISYDLQAGSYIRAYKSAPDFLNAYANEMAELVSPHLEAGYSVLDAGCGELTTSTLLFNKLRLPAIEFFGFDISWSRLYEGRKFQEQYSNSFSKFNIFVAEMKRIPLPTKSIDVLITNHALEPNGADLDLLLEELIRVTRKKLILFEPWYENNSAKGKARMDQYGYIKRLAERCEHLNCTVEKITPMEKVINELNPTACFVVSPATPAETNYRKSEFTVPGTNELLQLKDQFLYTERSGLAFPILEQIPILKMGNKIIATAL